MDLKLDDTGDLAIALNDLVLVDGGDAILQSAGIHLRTIVGEWSLDPTLGYIDTVQLLGRGGSLASRKARTRAELRKVPGVLTVTTVDVSVDPSTSTLIVNATGTATSGPLDLTALVPV
jgi:hypothetical protein